MSHVRYRTPSPIRYLFAQAFHLYVMVACTFTNYTCMPFTYISLSKEDKISIQIGLCRKMCGIVKGRQCTCSAACHGECTADTAPVQQAGPRH